jgi:hypothetical protein
MRCCGSAGEMEREAGVHTTEHEFSLKGRFALLPASETLALALQPGIDRISTRSPAGRRHHTTALGLHALVTRMLNETHWHANVGYSRATEESEDDDLFLGGAVSRRVSRSLRLQAELYTRLSPHAGGRPTWAVNIAAKQKLSRSFTAVVRLGTGLNRRSPKLNALVGFEWEP